MKSPVETVSGISAADEHELIRLLRMLERTNAFWLQAAKCDVPAVQKAYLRWIEKQSAVHGKKTIVIDLTLKQIENLRVYLQDAVKARYPEEAPSNLALMVVGLEWSIMLDHDDPPVVAQQLNVERNQYQQHLPYPTVLWLPCAALRKLEREFSIWEGKAYEFTGESELSSPQSERGQASRSMSLTEAKIEEIRLLKHLRAQMPNLTDDPPAESRRLHRNWAYRLGETYQTVGHHDQAIPLLTKALELDADDTWQYATRVHHTIGVSFWQTSQISHAINSFDHALSLAQERGEKHLEFTALGNLGTIYNDLSNYETATDYYEKALAISKEIGDRRGEAVLLGNLGVTHENQGDLESSIRRHEAALEISRDMAEPSSEAKHLGNLGGVYGKRGDWQTAIDYFERALSISRAIGDRGTEGAWLGNLGATHSHLGDDEAAAYYYHQALLLSRKSGDRRSEGLWLGKLGLTYRQLDRNDIALACFNALKTIGVALQDPHIVAWVEEDMERLKAKVGVEKFEHLKAEVKARQHELTP